MNSTCLWLTRIRQFSNEHDIMDKLVLRFRF